MPDVRLPDGTVVRNVPEGTTRAQLAARLGKSMPKKATTGGFGHGLADSATMGFLDEAGAVADSLGIGMSGEKRQNIFNGASFGDAFNSNLKRNRQVLDEKRQTKDFLPGQIAGAFVPLPGGKAVLATKAGQALKVAQTGNRATVLGKLGKLAAQTAPDVARGTVYGAASAEGSLAQRAKGAVRGAETSLGGHLVGRGLGKAASRLLKGKTVSPAVQKLADSGIVMTPGQRAGQGSVRKSIEEGFLGSLPIVKAIPNAAKRRGIEQLNVAAINEALAPIGAKLPIGTKPGRELVAKAGDLAYSAYDDSVTDLILGNDDGLKKAVRGIVTGSRASVGANSDQLNSIIVRTMTDLEKGPVAGSRVRDILSDVRGEASDFVRSPVANERRMGKELWKLHDELDGALMRQNTGARVARFKAAREAVNGFKRIEDASARSKDGVFGPGQLAAAVKKKGFGTTTRKVARGEAKLQELSDAASQVLPDTLPNSGSPERLLATGLLGGAPTSIGAFLDPTAGAVTAASLAGYAPGIDKLLQDLALKRPDLLRKLGGLTDRATPALGTAGTMTALGVTQQP